MNVIVKKSKNKKWIDIGNQKKISLIHNKRQCGIYCIRNIVNGKIYIGSSKCAYERWHFHKKQLRNNRHDNVHLQSSWNQYGEENFEAFLIEKCNKTDLIKQEQLYLDNTLCLNNKHGYNINDKADRVTLTVEMRRKMSHKGAEHPNYGKHLSIETKAKIGAAQTGTKNHNFGKITPKNVRQKISKSESGDNHYKYDSKIYMFSHPKHGIEKSTKYDLKTKYKLFHVYDLISGVRKSDNGWKILSKNQ